MRNVKIESEMYNFKTKLHYFHYFHTSISSIFTIFQFIPTLMNAAMHRSNCSLLMRSTQLNPNPCESFGNHGKEKSDHINSFFQKSGSKFWATTAS